MNKKEILLKITRLQINLLKKQNISTGMKKVNLDYEALQTMNHVSNVLSLFDDLPIQKGFVVDVGSGNGNKTLALSNFFSAASGIEPVKEEFKISLLKKEYFSNKKTFFANEGAEQMNSVKTNSIDFIFCETVLEHVNSVSKTIKEFSRVAKKGSFGYIACPNYNWIYETHYHIYMPPLVPKLYFKIYSYIFNKDASFIDHINYTTPKTIIKLLKKNGFEILENVSETKLDSFLSGRLPLPPHYSYLTSFFKFTRFIGLNKLLSIFFIFCDFYPVIELKFWRPND